MAPKSWAEDGLNVGDSSPGPAHGVRRPHGCWHADHSRRLVTSLSPQSGYALGCSLPLQPDCSARLRSLLDDYQTALFTGCVRPPRATESHPQPRTHSCGNQPASIVSLRGASVSYPTKEGSTSCAHSRIYWVFSVASAALAAATRP